MKAILCTAGNGSRWRNYTDRRKHMAIIDGEPVLLRTIRQLRERGVHDIVLDCHRDHVYQIPNVQKVTGLDPLDVFVGRKALWRHFHNDQATIVILGDAWFSDEAMDMVVDKAESEPQRAFHQIGRLRPSVATGKPGPEMFGWVLGCQRHHDFIKAIEVCQDAKVAGTTLYNDWSIYQAMAGRPVDTHPNDLLPSDFHLELPDDGTDDFDFPDDYERWQATMRGLSSRRVRAKDFEGAWFSDRLEELKLHHKLHRKPWEFCSIVQAFHDRYGDGLGRSAIGFGVGKDPVAAWLANIGAKVTATDRPEPGIWLERQHATGLEGMRYEGVCPEERFKKNVVFAPVDMNAIPSGEHGQHDFAYSASCFEHLGGIDAGLKFFCEQMKCLKPGGLAAHTTEWRTTEANVGDITLNGDQLCVFRTEDLNRLGAMLEAQGDRLWPIDLTRGNQIADGYVDVPPFENSPAHLQLTLGGVVFTSVLLLAMRGYHA